jgi:lysophospholipase L1-like esterase
MGFVAALLLVAYSGATTAGAPIAVTCVGDSITSEGGNLTYSLQLGRLLGAGFNVTNAGVSGHTMMNDGLCGLGSGSWRRPCLPTSSMPSCYGNCSYWGTPTFAALANCAATNDCPHVITIMLGTNDAKYCNWFGPPNGVPPGAGTAFGANYVAMIKLFKALPTNPKVYVVLPPPAVSQCTATGPAGNATICLAYNMSYTAINVIYPVLQRSIAKTAGADGVIDVWTALNGTSISPHASVDGIHPYPPALGVIAETIASVIGSLERGPA